MCTQSHKSVTTLEITNSDFSIKYTLNSPYERTAIMTNFTQVTHIISMSKNAKGIQLQIK
jgi:hypothetical protein